MAGSSAARRTFVVDTSVLLADPLALERFEEHDVVRPPRRDLRARGQTSPSRARLHGPRRRCGTSRRHRTEHGTLTEPIPVGDGGTMRVELNHVDGSDLRRPMRSESNDGRILAVAHHLARGRRRRRRRHEGPAAAAQGLAARARRRGVPQRARRRRRLGAASSSCASPPSVIDALYELNEIVDLDDTARPARATLASCSRDGSRSALGRLHPDKVVRRINGSRELFGVGGRSAEQRIALDLLADPEVGDRLARWRGRHGQVDPGARRRASRPCSSSDPQARRRVPPAARRRRPGARVPPRVASPRRCSRGPRR